MFCELGLLLAAGERQSFYFTLSSEITFVWWTVSSAAMCVLDRDSGTPCSKTEH